MLKTWVLILLMIFVALTISFILYGDILLQEVVTVTEEASLPETEQKNILP